MGDGTLPLEDRDQLVRGVMDLVSAGVVSVDDFIRAYNEHRSILKQTPRFAVLDVEAGGEMEAIPAALRLAIADDFLVALWMALLQKMAKLHADEEKLKAIQAAIGTMAPVGIMQKVLRAAGVRPVKTIPSLMRAARATALISAKVPGTSRKTFGSGFMVAPTLMMTAAHVVEQLIDNENELEDSAQSVTVEFWNQLEGQGQWPVKAHFAKKWLVCMSPPNGQDGKLALGDPADAARQLDFALVQLSEPIGNITGTVDMLDPPDPAVEGRLTVIGYPGGTECVFDDHQVTKYEAATGRIQHDVNAQAGMSGGPCIDHEGKLVGLHEGSVTNANPEYNRAVHLKLVRASIKKKAPDPLLMNTGPLQAIFARDVRQAWVAAGETLIGTTDQKRTEWLDSVAHLNPDDVRAGVSADVLHPVFGRTGFQSWIDEASLENSSRRIALISGDPGAGKSFSLSILREKLRSAQHRVVFVQPTMANRAIEQVLEFIVSESGGKSLKPTDATLRPDAGMLRRDLLPGLFEQLSDLIASRGGKGELLWIAIDVGDDAALTGDIARDLKQFLINAEKEPWVRLVIVGLSNSRRGEFRAAAAKPNEVESSSLKPVSVEEFLDTMLKQAEALQLDPKHWEQESTLLWDEEVESLSTKEGRSVIAVRLALELRALMLKEAGS